VSQFDFAHETIAALVVMGITRDVHGGEGNDTHSWLTGQSNNNDSAMRRWTSEAPASDLDELNRSDCR
jgi:hypothetical protein